MKVKTYLIKKAKPPEKRTTKKMSKKRTVHTNNRNGNQITTTVTRSGPTTHVHRGLSSLLKNEDSRDE